MRPMDPLANNAAGPQPSQPQQPLLPQQPEQLLQPPMPPMPPMPPAAGPPRVPAAAAAQPDMTLPLPPMPDTSQQSAVPAPTAQIPQDQAHNDVSSTTNVTTPQVIDDGDLIEKEWVHKAKQIVDRNRNDPYKQSEELTAFRADYMKKRYNKDIKVDK